VDFLRSIFHQAPEIALFAALALGYWVGKFRFGSFQLGGVAGSLLAPIYTLQPQIGGNFILAAFAVVVLGGMGSVAGAYIGGLAVGIVESFAGYYVDPALKQAIWFLIFIAVLVVRPSGLFGRKGTEELGLRQH